MARFDRTMSNNSNVARTSEDADAMFPVCRNRSVDEDLKIDRYVLMWFE